MDWMHWISFNILSEWPRATITQQRGTCQKKGQLDCYFHVLHYLCKLFHKGFNAAIRYYFQSPFNAHFGYMNSRLRFTLLLKCYIFVKFLHIGVSSARSSEMLDNTRCDSSTGQRWCLEEGRSQPCRQTLPWKQQSLRRLYQRRSQRRLPARE